MTIEKNLNTLKNVKYYIVDQPLEDWPPGPNNQKLKQKKFFMPLI